MKGKFRSDKKNVVKDVKQPKTPAQKVGIILAIVFVVATILKLLTNFITDWMWFSEMGYLSVFLKKLLTELKFGLPAFILISVLMDLYLRKLRKGYFTKIVSHEVADIKKLNVITNIISILFGFIVSSYFATGLWFQLLQFTNSTKFNIKDPLFSKDISFYIFKFEFLKKLNEMLIGIILLFIAVTIIYYIILMTVRTPDRYEEGEARPYSPEEARAAWEAREASREEFTGPGKEGVFNKSFREFKNSRRANGRRYSESNFRQLMNIASGQLTFVGVIFFIMLGIHFYLKQFDLLHAHTGAVYGAGFTDVNITLWIYRALIALSVAGAITTVIYVKKKDFKKLIRVPVIMVIVGIAGVATAAVVQNMVVAPDEINKEKKYLANNIEYTQYAYDVNDVDIKPFKADNNLTVTDLSNNKETINNIRINDYEPVKTFYNQTQSIRQYYKFNDIDVDRYDIDGKYTQTYMSLREIDEDKINDTWLNRHLKYTHGYGLALSRVDTITPSGQPDVLIKNIPPESSIKNMKVKQPEVYFGELSNDYIVVNTSEDEFNYPDGNSNKYSRYKGKAGIKLNPFNRIMFSMREGSMKLLVSSNVKSDSRIIINRNVKDRVETIMPYLRYENDPYAVMVDGKFYWIIDAYTASQYYPYSEPFDNKSGTNYIRNSVKVVVDAYNGDVNYYIVDDKDPIAQTMSKVFPKLFKPMDKMPEGIKMHIRYPNSLFKIQADVYGRYHMNDVKVFYQNEDIWDIANEIYGTEQKEMKPNYYIARLPGEKTTEFISVLPFTPKSKQNMTALMIARNDGDEYGKLVLYQFPKNKTVYGPMQIEAQIDQNTTISSDFSLWSQAGSKYSRGNLFVVPIENSLLYVEPIYLEASNTAIPEVKRVIVAYGDRIAYEPTLAEALEDLFGEGSGVQSVVPEGGKSGEKSEKQTLTTQDYIKKAQEAFDNGQKALKDGNWSDYGKAMQELESALGKMGK